MQKSPTRKVDQSTSSYSSINFYLIHFEGFHTASSWLKCTLFYYAVTISISRNVFKSTLSNVKIARLPSFGQFVLTRLFTFYLHVTSHGGSFHFPTFVPNIQVSYVKRMNQESSALCFIFPTIHYISVKTPDLFPKIKSLNVSNKFNYSFSITKNLAWL